MSRIIWRRVRSEWVGRLTAAGPDRFAVRKVDFQTLAACTLGPWQLTDLASARQGHYERLMDAKSAAETLR